MKKRNIVLTLVIVLLLAAIAIPVSAGGNGQNKYEGSYSYAYYWSYCSGEYINMDVEYSGKNHSFATPSGNYHYNGHEKGSLSGIGMSSGDTYTGDWKYNYVFNGHKGETNTYKYHYTVENETTGETYEYVSEYQYTINANGELTVNNSTYEYGCS